MSRTDQHSMPQSKRKLRNVFIFFGIIGLTALILVILNLTKEAVQSKPVEEKRWNIRVIEAKSGLHSPSLSVFGKIESPATSTLTSNISGTVTATPKLDGQSAESGEVILDINPSEAQRIQDQRLADLNEAKANLATQQTKHEFDLKTLEHEQALLKITEKSVSRSKTLKQKNLSADTELDNALMAQTQQAIRVSQIEQSLANHPNQVKVLEARVLRADAAYQQAKEDLENTRIKAPFNSRLSTVHVSVGDRVSKGTPLVSLYAKDQLELRVHIPTHTANTIREQLTQYQQDPQTIKAQIEVAGFPYQLPFDRLAGEVKQGSGGLDAIFTLNSDDVSNHPPINTNALPLGKTVSALIILPPVEQTMVVPASSIYQENYIYQVVNDQLKSIKINRLGQWYNREEPNQSFWIITAEIEEGSKILSSLLPNAIDGLKVEIHE